MQNSAKHASTTIVTFLVPPWSPSPESPAVLPAAVWRRRHEVDFFLSLRCPLCINQSSSSATSGVVSWPWLWPGSTGWPPTCSASTPRRRTRRSWPSCSSPSGCFASFWSVGQAGFSAWLQLWTSDHSFPVLPDKHDYTCYDILIIYHFFFLFWPQGIYFTYL